MTKPNRAVVTGASSGIGESLARELAEQKVSLVLVARRLDRLEKLASELKTKHGIQVDCFQSDLTDPNAMRILFERCTEGGKSVDFLINNAGVGFYKNFLEGDLRKQMDLIQLNLSSLLEGTHLFGNHMRAHGRPSYILNVASVVAYQGTPKFAVYSASKFAVRIFSRIIGAELANTNVSVTCLCPGGTRTEFIEHAGQTPTSTFSEKYWFMDSVKVARIGLAGTYAKKPVVIPGLLNKIVCFLVRLVPESVGLRLGKMSMDSAVRES